MHRRIITSFLLFIFLFVSSCSSPSINSSPTQAEPAPNLQGIWLPPYLPPVLVSQIYLPASMVKVDDPSKADIRVDVGSDYLVTDWIFALVAPFPTVTDDLSSQDLLHFWQGELVSNLPFKRLVMDGSTQTILAKLWGDSSTAQVNSVSSQDLLDTSWTERTTWAIIPFDEIQPKWKVISLDGQSPIEKTFDANKYLLNIPFSFVGKSNLAQSLVKDFGRDGSTPIMPASNRDAKKMTIVAMTGVTAMVRGTAYMMEKYGMTYPALNIGDILRNTDITHISNEVPFWPQCPKPFGNPVNDRNLVFCSRPDYIQLLEAVGTDVVELTGDHFRDWGPQPMLYTLNMYDQRGWKYYGGGRNLEDGLKPALFEVNGNKIAFLGCNAKPEGYATASATNPGAVHCDLDLMSEKIKEVVKQGYLPIFTFQHIEYYKYTADPHLVADFEKVAAAGAVIVSGSQAHQPQALEFFNGSLLHYGLGNLFFDQFTEGFDQRKAFIDLHVFYDGKYINTQMVSIMFIDMARARLMTPAEREYLLKDVFYASNW